MNNPTDNGQTDLDAVLGRMSPDNRAAFLRARLRLKKFDENDEFLAIANYMDHFALLINSLTHFDAKQEIEALKTIIHTEGDARKVEAGQLCQHLDTLLREIRDLRTVSDRIHKAGHWLGWEWTACAAVLGAAVTIVAEHFFFHVL